MSQRDTVALLAEASHKSKREVEGLLLSKSPEGALPKEKVRRVTETLKEAKFILDPKLQQLLERYEELHGKQQISEILTDLLEAHLRNSDPLRRTIAASNHCVKKESREKTPATHTTEGPKKPTPSSSSRYISAGTRNFLWKRSQGVCEWVISNLENGVPPGTDFNSTITRFPSHEEGKARQKT